MKTFPIRMQDLDTQFSPLFLTSYLHLRHKYQNLLNYKVTTYLPNEMSLEFLPMLKHPLPRSPSFPLSQNLDPPSSSPKLERKYVISSHTRLSTTSRKAKHPKSHSLFIPSPPLPEVVLYARGCLAKVDTVLGLRKDRKSVV